MTGRKLKFTIINLIYVGLIYGIGSIITTINGYNPDYIQFCIFHSGMVTIICGLFTGVSFGTDFLKTWRYRPELDEKRNHTSRESNDSAGVNRQEAGGK